MSELERDASACLVAEERDSLVELRVLVAAVYAVLVNTCCGAVRVLHRLRHW